MKASPGRWRSNQGERKRTKRSEKKESSRDGMRKLSIERCSLAVNSETESKKLLSGRCYLGLSEAADEVSSCRTSRRVREACQLTACSTKVDRYPPLGDKTRSSYVESLYYCRRKFQAHHYNAYTRWF